VSAFLASAVGSSSNGLVLALSSGLGSALVVLAGQMFLRRQQRDSLIATASEQVVESMQALILSYRQELAESKAELGKLRERVAALERELELAKADQQEVVRKREEALKEIERLKARIEQLQSDLSRLERTTERRQRRQRPPSENG
jgi:peptidoglycan hydrolase CwlO-like protein